jgi:hypothetical protein
VHADSPHSNVKDESSNLNNLTTTLSSIVMCAPLQLEQPFASFCFGHAMAKNANMPQMTKKNVGLEVIKKFDKGKQEWDRACVEVGLSTQRLKTLVKTQFARKVVFFKETFKYANNINI